MRTENEQIGQNMFIGEHNHTIDIKGRLIVPSKFRDDLGAHFYLTKGIDGCLMAYDEEEWASFEGKLKSLPMTNKDARKMVRFFLAGAADAEVDKQGRILIPQPLRDYAGLEKDIVLAGMGNRVEIWSRDRYEGETTYEDMDEIAAQLESLGLSI